MLEVDVVQRSGLEPIDQSGLAQRLAVDLLPPDDLFVEGLLQKVGLVLHLYLDLIVEQLVAGFTLGLGAFVYLVLSQLVVKPSLRGT